VKLLIEGRPGSGKTTVARRLVSLLSEHRGALAHVDIVGPRVGKYGVDVDGFEHLVLPALELDEDKTIVVIDELGKMELLSDAFRRSVEKLFDNANKLVATVHAFKHPFTDALKQRPDTDVVKVTRANRDDLPQTIAIRVLSESN